MEASLETQVSRKWQMEYQDYYKTLGLQPDASAVDIKKAFRKAARKYHPDVNPDAKAQSKFKAVNEAYEVLKDPERRAAYDQLAKEPPRGQGHYRPPPNWDSGFTFSGGYPQGEGAFSDFFETLFRRADAHPGGTATEQAADSHARIEIDLEDAYHGSTRTLNIRTPVVGADGSLSMQDRAIAVQIPKGILPGQHIRLAGQGASGLGGATAGDLFLEVSFAPHPIYHIDGRDLYFDLPVAPWEAALGGHVVLPTPAGKVDLRIPQNARTGQKLRLKGKGLPGAPAGDIYAALKIVNPTVTTAEAKGYFEKMARDIPFNPRAHLGG